VFSPRKVKAGGTARFRDQGCHGCAFGGQGSMILVMQEVLSKTDDPKVALRDQEFYELRLYDSDVAGEPVYCFARGARTMG